MTLHEQFVDLWDRQREKRQPTQSQGTPAPWEGISQVAQSLGINLGELWKTREEELKAARDAADATSKELHELRLREIDRRVQELQALADKIDQKAQQSQNPSTGQKGFLEKLEEITQGLISQRIASMLEDNHHSTDPVDEFFKRLDQVEKVKERFSGGSGGSAQALAQTGIRGELLKLLLEDERERLRMQYEHDIQAERNKHLGTLASTVKENLGDGIRALQAAAAEFKSGTSSAKEQPQAYECGACKTKFVIPQGIEVEQVKCPGCGKIYSKQELES
jgi:translation elongation factor EF-1beta/DNA-directed RNA polymerase subunit RPC12/RpoP